MTHALQALEDQYFTVRDSLSVLVSQHATPDQLNQLRSQIAQSRTNYWTAINKVLHDDDPAVSLLVTKMNQEQQALQNSIGHLGDVSRVLDVITQAVNIGTQLAGMAVAL